MLEEGDTAPTFEAPMATPENAAGKSGEFTAGEVEPFALEEALADGPVALAFFPGAFSRTCTSEVCAIRDWLAEIGELDAQVYGASADMPWALLAFIREYGLNFPMLSGFNSSMIADFGVRRDEGLLAGISNRSVFVIDRDGTVVYRWVVTEPGVLPDFGAIREAVASA